MRILGIDTATWKASVGLVIDGEVRAEQSEFASGSHAVSLLPLIDAVLRQADCPLSSLDAIAISGGPGSFTGLRIAFSTAKGLARATGARLITVPTLEALARTVADRHGVICALLDARKGELYAACFESSETGWRRLTADMVSTPAALLAHLSVPCVILGDAVGAYGDWLRQHLGTRVTLLPFETHGPSGGTIALLGARRLATTAASDIASLEPCYIRASEAELKAAAPHFDTPARLG